MRILRLTTLLIFVVATQAQAASSPSACLELFRDSNGKSPSNRDNLSPLAEGKSPSWEVKVLPSPKEMGSFSNSHVEMTGVQNQRYRFSIPYQPLTSFTPLDVKLAINEHPAKPDAAVIPSLGLQVTIRPAGESEPTQVFQKFNVENYDGRKLRARTTVQLKTPGFPQGQKVIKIARLDEIYGNPQIVQILREVSVNIQHLDEQGQVIPGRSTNNSWRLPDEDKGVIVDVEAPNDSMNVIFWVTSSSGKQYRLFNDGTGPILKQVNVSDLQPDQFMEMFGVKEVVDR